MLLNDVQLARFTHLKHNMLPLTLLKGAQTTQMMVELKNGETFNGTLVNCDSWMNLNLKDVVCTSRDGTSFYQMPECYVRGNLVKYIRVSDDILTQVSEEAKKERTPKPARGGRGRGRGTFGRGNAGFGRGNDAGRGRGENANRGQQNGRGRGDSTRGRGDSGRGRGDARGRGQSSQRGRGRGTN
ncbi:U6 snRNA-associated Sm-like protein LSm4 [Acrasis kona]|uniref:U6 snRNA-associated Sm-like protein LSm4 n=1 Tax=Acrasis kona TaxID=1008807 RepID=A0AAW2YUI8_9EUKA